MRPWLHTEAGHRLYSAGDVGRLQQVVSLRQLGFSLEEIRDCLERPEFSPLEVIRLHVARMREQIELQQGLCERLEALAAQFQVAEPISAEAFLQAMEVMNMIETYYTPEQLETLRERREAGGYRDGEPGWIAFAFPPGPLMRHCRPSVARRLLFLVALGRKIDAYELFFATKV